MTGTRWVIVGLATVALVIGVLVMAAIVLFLKQRDHSRAAVAEAVEA